jgi:hypothetical protein
VQDKTTASLYIVLEIVVLWTPKENLFVEKPTILDILLFPRSFFAKITDKLPTLFLGILFVGLSDAAFLLLDYLPVIFLNKTLSVLIFNSTLALCDAILLGLIKVVFFALPLFDLFKLFRVKERIKNINSQLIKLMKVYICAHFIIVPVGAFFEATVRLSRLAGMGANYSATMALIQFVLLPTWLSAIVTRGINTIYNFDDRLKNMVFVIAYTWILLISIAMKFSAGRWIPILFK